MYAMARVSLVSWEGVSHVPYSGKICRALNLAKTEKNGYELILPKFKFADWALAKAMTSSLLYLHHAQNIIWREFNLPIFFNLPNHQIKALDKFSRYTVLYSLWFARSSKCLPFEYYIYIYIYIYYIMIFPSKIEQLSILLYDPQN